MGMDWTARQLDCGCFSINRKGEVVGTRLPGCGGWWMFLRAGGSGVALCRRLMKRLGVHASKHDCFVCRGSPERAETTKQVYFLQSKRSRSLSPGRVAGWSTSKGRQRGSRRALRPPAGGQTGVSVVGADAGPAPARYHGPQRHRLVCSGFAPTLQAAVWRHLSRSPTPPATIPHKPTHPSLTHPSSRLQCTVSGA